MPWTDAGRRKAAAHRKGSHLSKATKAKISKALKGKKKKHTGHPMTPAQKAALIAHDKSMARAAALAKIAARKKLGNRPVSRRKLGFLAGGITNAQILGIARKKRGTTNTKVLDLKEHKFIHGNQRRSNRSLVTHRVHRRRRH